MGLESLDTWTQSNLNVKSHTNKANTELKLTARRARQRNRRPDTERILCQLKVRRGRFCSHYQS